MSIVGSADKLLQLSQTVRLGQGEYQLRLDVRLSCLLTSHLQKLNQVLPVICKNTQQHSLTPLWFARDVNCIMLLNYVAVLASGLLTVLAGCVHHLHVRRGVNSFDVGVNGLLDQVSLQLSSAQLAPHRRLITALCKLVGTIQVPDVFNQDLQGEKSLLRNLACGCCGTRETPGLLRSTVY